MSTDRLYEQEGCAAHWLGCSGRVRGELLCSGNTGCPIINPLPVAPTVQMVPEAHMASNLVIGILLSERLPVLLLLPPSLTPHSFFFEAFCSSEEINILATGTALIKKKFNDSHAFLRICWKLWLKWWLIIMKLSLLLPFVAQLVFFVKLEFIVSNVTSQASAGAAEDLIFLSCSLFQCLVHFDQAGGMEGIRV